MLTGTLAQKYVLGTRQKLGDKIIQNFTSVLLWFFYALKIVYIYTCWGPQIKTNTKVKAQLWHHVWLIPQIIILNKVE